MSGRGGADADEGANLGAGHPFILRQQLAHFLHEIGIPFLASLLLSQTPPILARNFEALAGPHFVHQVVVVHIVVVKAPADLLDDVGLFFSF